MEYCVQTGVTGIRKSCEICYPNQRTMLSILLTSFIRTILHGSNRRPWEKAYNEWPDQVNLTLKFGKIYLSIFKMQCFRRADDFKIENPKLHLIKITYYLRTKSRAGTNSWLVLDDRFFNINTKSPTLYCCSVLHLRSNCFCFSWAVMFFSAVSHIVFIKFVSVLSLLTPGEYPSGNWRERWEPSHPSYLFQTWRKDVHPLMFCSNVQPVHWCGVTVLRICLMLFETQKELRYYTKFDNYAYIFYFL